MTEPNTQDAVDQVNRVEIENVTFEAVEHSTFEHDLHLVALIRDAGLDDLSRYAALAPEARALQLLRDVVMSGRTFDILAAVLTRAGVPWSEEAAATNAAFFRQVRDPASKQLLQAALVELLLSFFTNAPGESVISPSSLAMAVGSTTTTPANAAAPSTGASGTTSSASSLATTPRGRSRSRAGR